MKLCVSVFSINVYQIIYTSYFFGQIYIIFHSNLVGFCVSIIYLHHNVSCIIFILLFAK